MSTILVTGRNGFIGQELTPVLRKEHRIISIVRQAKEHMDYSGEELIVNDIRNVRTQGKFVKESFKFEMCIV